MKKLNKSPLEPVDKQHYKKRYLLRKQQEHEAEKERKEYSPSLNPICSVCGMSHSFPECQ